MGDIPFNFRLQLVERYIGKSHYEKCNPETKTKLLKMAGKQIQKDIIDKNRATMNELQIQLRKTKKESNINQSMSNSRAENTIFNLLNETVNNKKKDELY